MNAREWSRVEHQDPRERLLMLYGVWVKCLPHQIARRMLVERCIANCKAVIAERNAERADGGLPR